MNMNMPNAISRHGKLNFCELENWNIRDVLRRFMAVPPVWFGVTTVISVLVSRRKAVEIAVHIITVVTPNPIGRLVTETPVIATVIKAVLPAVITASEKAPIVLTLGITAAWLIVLT